jgi:small subunit ribosomal protein S2
MPIFKKAKIKKLEEKGEQNSALKEMTEAGVAFGHRTSKLHPKMKSYILGMRSTIHIIDLSQTIPHLEKALKLIEQIAKEDGQVLLVGTRIQFQEIIEETAKKCNFPYVNHRWIGGTLTNFKVVGSRVNHLKELEDKEEKGELKKYTKKEQLDFKNQVKKLENKFGGLKNMSALPQAIFIIDFDKNFLAAKEARSKGIKTIALVDTNMNPQLVDYPIPANDDALSSVKYILDKMTEKVIGIQQENKKMRPKKPQDKPKVEEQEKIEKKK